MSWSYKHTFDREGNKVQRIKYEPNIEREGYFYINLKDDEYMDYLHKEWMRTNGKNKRLKE